LSHPQGFTQAEIARILGVNRSTIHRDLCSLEVYEGEHGKIILSRDVSLFDVRFNLNEALALHLAGRLMATRMDRHNPYAASAINRLGIATRRLAPTIGDHLIRSADAMSSQYQVIDPVYIEVLEKLTQAWASGHKVRILYQSDKTKAPKEHTLAPYFIEVSAVGQSTYLMGWHDTYQSLRTFKIERILTLELLDDLYEVPADFDPYATLEHAWGIWFNQGEPVTVRLRFSAHVAERVKETRWHRSQEIEPVPDGSLLWSALVDEPIEMTPWIRSWGPEVEVLEPQELRKQFFEEAQELIKLYAQNPSDGGTIQA
jgi:CRISPR-associated endonuclease/helicase Cas3